MNLLLCRFCSKPLKVRGSQAFFQCLCEDEVRSVPVGDWDDYGHCVRMADAQSLGTGDSWNYTLTFDWQPKDS